ncbi:MAG TPA: penicillin-binding protein 2 [Anaerolineae bacterium]|nr:penicillin-binding protein 2 [Anaerolineae bacterium]
MNNSQYYRLLLVITGLLFVTTIIIGRLIVFQAVQGEDWAARGLRMQNVSVEAKPERGTIFDRNGAVLAANSQDYQLGVSPSLVTDPAQVATALAPILETDRFAILAKLESDHPYELLSGRISPEVANAIRELDYDGLQLDPLPRRIYPQGDLLCHVLGYTDFQGVGGAGLEGYYQRELAGEAASATQNVSPLAEQINVIAREGADIVLTIDRSVQYLVEEHLERAMRQYQASSGTIIVMNPRTGAIIAMANHPCYEPYRFFEANDRLLVNPAVSQQYEPGSVMKLITMAAALDSGTVTPQSTYYDAGIFEIGGAKIYNADRSGTGTTDMTTLMARSLNVGAAYLATEMGPDNFYSYLLRFGFGRPTGIDLLSEANGTLYLPGDPFWTESSLATNSFGQGIAVTPLQMISAASAIANDGYLMQPYLVQEKYTAEGIFVHEPTVLSRPISAQTARQVTAMAIATIAREIDKAQLNGYTIAGKTGTAQIAENGIYHPTDVIGSFIGWLPGDNPEVIVLVKLDRPKSAPWGSETAAPAFADLAYDLVTLLDIPPDTIRLRADVMAARNQGN